MESTDDIIGAFGGYAGLAAALGVPPGTVSAWKTRHSIPAEYWGAVVAAAASRSLDGITFEVLAALAPQRKPRAQVAGAAA